MEFAKRLREGVRCGDITCSIRIWMRPQVKRGGRYRMGEGAIVIDSIDPIELADITPKLARESGFDSVIDLLKTAKHGRGTNVYLIRFHYVPAGADRDADAPPPAKTDSRRKKPSGDRVRNRVIGIVERLPEAVAIARGTHLSLEVRKKRFGYFLQDHHDDGRIAINCKASPDLHELLAERIPAQFHIPKYVGSKGWIGLWLDTAAVDWAAVEIALREAHALVAPKRPARKAP